MEGRSFTVHVEPLRDAAGAIRGTVGIALDITDVRRADQALRDSEARLRQVIDLVPHFIFAKDERGPLPPREPGGGRGLRHRRWTG